MFKLLTSFIVLFLVAIVAVGCGKKEAPESMEMTMPMSVSVEGSGTTNMVTKAGTPVQTSGTAATPVTSEMPATETESAAVEPGYTPPSAQDIQQALKGANLYAGAIDGKLGPASKRAITEFQQQNGLTADGKVGKKTWEKLKEHLNQVQQ